MPWLRAVPQVGTDEAVAGGGADAAPAAADLHLELHHARGERQPDRGQPSGARRVSRGYLRSRAGLLPGHPRVLFQIHRPDLGEGLVGSDDRSEIFYTSDEQRQVAEDTITDADASGLWHSKVVTKISEGGPFWEAEAEDQDYLQQFPEDKNQFSP
jgi:hypothetical protein